MTTFYLVRHGVTPETGRKLTGWTPGVHLNEAGRKQAAAAAEALAKAKVKAIYSSPIDRTMDTAEELGRRLALPVVPTEAMGEIRFGRWTNRPLKQLARTKMWTAVQRWPSGVRFPDGETFAEAQARAVVELERLREAHKKQAIAIVSHSDLIKLVTAHYLGLHLDQFQRIHIAPASITTISVNEYGPYVLNVNHIPPALEESVS